MTGQVFTAPFNGCTLQAVRNAFRDDGYVVLGDVISPESRSALQAEFELQAVQQVLGGAWPEDIETSDRSADGLPPLFHPGHGGTTLPRAPPLLTADLVANRDIETVVEALLDHNGSGGGGGGSGGSGCRLVNISGNCCFPGSGTQYLHMDHTWRYPSAEAAAAAGQPWPLPTECVVVNYSVCEASARNGMTELWPGSHVDPAAATHDRKLSMQLQEHHADAVAARRHQRPPLQPSVPASGCLIRDMRVWHRGVQNHSERPRPMVALIYGNGSYSRSHAETYGPGLETFSTNCRPFFECSRLAREGLSVRFDDEDGGGVSQAARPTTLRELQAMRRDAVAVGRARPWADRGCWMEKAIDRAIVLAEAEGAAAAAAASGADATSRL